MLICSSMRGAGTNFGIITSATYMAAKAADHSNGNVLNTDLHLSPNNTAAYFASLESVDGKVPGNVGSVHIALFNGITGQAS